MERIVLLLLVMARASLNASTLALTSQNLSPLLGTWAQPINTAGLLDHTFGGIVYVTTLPIGGGTPA